MAQATVNLSEEAEEWLVGLEPRERGPAVTVLRMLERMGVTLPAPWSSALEGTKYPLRELRPQQGRSPLRIFYGFDSKREAYVMAGGDKAKDKRLYQRIIPKLERMWDEHQREIQEEDDNNS